jgi:hypothetical protein
MTIEERQVESVKWSVYGAYAKAGGGYWIIPLVGVLLVSVQISNIITGLWLSWWTSNKYKLSEGSYVSPIHIQEVSDNILTLNRLPSMLALV